MPEYAIWQNFAPDVPRVTQQQIAATQGLIKAARIADRISRPAWRTKNSWYLVSSDQPRSQARDGRSYPCHAGRGQRQLCIDGEVPGCVLHIISEDTVVH